MKIFYLKAGGYFYMLKPRKHTANRRAAADGLAGVRLVPLFSFGESQIGRSNRKIY